jgi:hypothetical protein
MNYQVLTFEGYDPIVTVSGDREITKQKQIKGLTYNHKYTASLFKTREEANSHARSLTKTKSEWVEVPTEIQEHLDSIPETPLEEPVKKVKKPKTHE